MDDQQIENQYEKDSDNFDRSFSARVFNPNLMALRAQMPFVEMMPFPNSTITVKLAANAAQDIQLPENCKLIRFNADAVYYVSRNGQAQVPGNNVDNTTGAIMSPNDRYFYVEEIRSLSVIAPAVTNLTVECFIQL